MIETTLQDAVERCKRDGGTFKRLKCADPLVFHVDEFGNVNDSDGDALQLCCSDFIEKWIYEPPKRSAFQEWSDKQMRRVAEGTNDKFSYSAVVSNTREAWNAAIDAVLNGFGEGHYFVGAIKELKEENNS